MRLPPPTCHHRAIQRLNEYYEYECHVCRGPQVRVGLATADLVLLDAVLALARGAHIDASPLKVDTTCSTHGTHRRIDAARREHADPEFESS